MGVCTPSDATTSCLGRFALDGDSFDFLGDDGLVVDGRNRFLLLDDAHPWEHLLQALQQIQSIRSITIHSIGHLSVDERMN